MGKKVLLISVVLVLLVILLTIYMAPFRIRLSGDVYSPTENHVVGQWKLDLIHVRIPLLGHTVLGKPQLPEGYTSIKFQGGGYWHCYSPEYASDLHMLTAPVYSEQDNQINFLSVTYDPNRQAAQLFHDGTEYLFPASTETEAQSLLAAISAKSGPN